jgi:cobalamin biosynthesis Mg chelatase CobN
VQVQSHTSDAAGTPAPTGTSSPSATPSEPPANPGTGEPAESEENRLDYAPYVIAAVLIITLLIVFIWRRRRGNKTVV